MNNKKRERHMAAMEAFWTAAVCALLVGCVGFGFCLCRAMQLAAW